MKTYAMKLVTIVTEPILTEKLLGELKSLGTTGATVTDVRGEGSRHLHSGEVPGEKVRIECVVANDVSERILSHVADTYFPHHSLIVFTSDVQVLRGGKYAP